MSFFERYFAALDGPEPHSSLDLVVGRRRVLDPVGRRRRPQEPRSSPAASEELRALHRRRRHGRLGAPRRLVGGTDGDVEFALGETRWDDGERIGTFLAVAQLDADGRMVRYMVARSPAIAFDTARGSMPALSSDRRRRADRRDARRAAAARLALPAAAAPSPSRARAPARVHVGRRRGAAPGAARGTLWTWTVQCFRAEVAALRRRGRRLRALRRRLRRAARRGARRGAAHRVRSRRGCGSAWRWSWC